MLGIYGEIFYICKAYIMHDPELDMKKVLYVLFFFLNFSIVQAANPFEISDDLYKIYQLAHRTEDVGRKFALADSMYQQAVKRKDSRAQLVALIIPMRYHYNQENKEELYNYIGRVESLARECNELRYYYYARALHSNYLKNHGELLQAMEEANKMMTQAEEDNSDYGIYSAYRLLGNIYETRGEYPVALTKYQEALVYGMRKDSEDDVSPVYRAMGWCNLNLNLLEKALECYQKGMDSAKNDDPKIACQLQMCFVLYQLGRYREFEENYQQVMRYNQETGGVQQRYLPRLNTMHYLIMDKYVQAFEEAQKMSDPTDVLELQIMIYKAQGNVKKALELSEELKHLTDSLQLKQHADYLAEVDAALGNTSLKLKTQELEKKQMRIMLFSLGVVLFLGVVIVVMLVIFLRKSRQMNSKLSRSNEELLVARNKALESDNLKTHFIQSISHEIRTPLNAVVGFSQLLTMADDEMSVEEKDELSHHILDSSNNLTRIVNNMLEISTLGASNVELNLEAIHVAHLCEHIIGLCMADVKPGVSLRYETSLSPDYVVESDAERISQILQNYISNAQKNTLEGEVVLSTELKDNQLYFYVTDTGCGIPEGMRENLFELFTKVDEFKAGVGLGLTICRMVALKLGGKVGFDSDYTDGARFWFALNV